ncbi:hypothetical protein Nepgr_032206 [Nepenthes gracilis]|uniref:Uncharacterized protein n=1 Tax=Nepenthes gracilis TaxID=150966 RepID=A0AAD3TI68_NEPGR|nr:hypothetical protein Nepgr_032206 [Nepenthes gracilis]
MDPVLKPPILGFSTSVRPDPPIANAVLVGWRNSCMDFDQLLLMTGSWIFFGAFLKELFGKLLWVLFALGFPVDVDFLVLCIFFDVVRASPLRSYSLFSRLELEFAAQEMEDSPPMVE